MPPLFLNILHFKDGCIIFSQFRQETNSLKGSSDNQPFCSACECSSGLRWRRLDLPVPGLLTGRPGSHLSRAQHMKILSSAGFTVSWLPATFCQWEALEGNWEVGGKEKLGSLLSSFPASSGICVCGSASRHSSPVWTQPLALVLDSSNTSSSLQLRDHISFPLLPIPTLSHWPPLGFLAVPSPAKPIPYIDFSHLNS